MADNRQMDGKLLWLGTRGLATANHKMCADCEMVDWLVERGLTGMMCGAIIVA